MNCFMFPGQPLSRAAQLPRDDDFADITDLVRRVAHLDLLSFQWLKGAGSDNVKLQVFGVAQSLHYLRLLLRQGVKPGFVAQHSMGIYPALVACGVLPEADAIEITLRVGTAIARMGEEESYALGCVIGMKLDPVLALAANNDVYLANHNTSRHFLLSGTAQGIESAMAEAVEVGAFSTRTFGCDAPLHTPLMAPLEEELGCIFADYRYAEPVIPLVNHLDQQYLDAAGIPGFMARELSQPVYWDRTYRTLRAAGAESFWEVGAGESLGKYNRWIESEIET